MKKIFNYTIIGLLAILLTPVSLFSQDDEAKVEDKPVRTPFESGILIDNQTSVVPEKKTLELLIQHRFGKINANGVSDLYGIYAPAANIRMGLNYTCLKI